MGTTSDPRLRRCDINRMTPEELRIRDCIIAVEALGAHVKLTDTVMQLIRAQAALADWIDMEDQKPGDR